MTGYLTKNRKKYLILVACFLSSVLFGIFFEYVYKYDDSPIYMVGQFKRELKNKQLKSSERMLQIQAYAIAGRLDTLPYLNLYDEDDIAYFVFSGSSLVFWSSNDYDVTTLSLQDLHNEQYVRLPNAHCVAQTVTKNGTTVLSLIKIKSQYGYENAYIKNEFAKGFRLDNLITIAQGSPDDYYAIFSLNGNYLFSLGKKDVSNNKSFKHPAIICWFLAIIFYFLLYFRIELWFGRRVYLPSNFLMIFVSFTAITILFLYFNIPSIIFSLELFSPYYYASGKYMSSLGHLILLSLWIVGSIAMFYFKVYLRLSHSDNKHRYSWLLFIQLFSLLVFFLICWMFADLIQNSTFNIAFFRIQDISIFTVLTFILVGLWFTAFVLFRNKSVGLLLQLFNLRKIVINDWIISCFLVVIFGLIENLFFLSLSLSYFLLCLVINVVRYRSKKYFSITALMLVVLCFTVFIVWFSFFLDNKKKIQKYDFLSENIFISQNIIHDFYVEAQLNQIDKDIKEDPNIRQYVALGDASTGRITRYMSRYYFQKINLNYEIHSTICSKHSDSNCHLHYADICDYGVQIDSSHFYNAYNTSAVFDYLGVFDFVLYNGDTTTLYIELQSKNKYRYSYPNLLLGAGDNVLPQQFSAAKYVNHRLIANRGDFVYGNTDEWIHGDFTESGSFYYNGNIHYVYPRDGNLLMVLSEPHFSMLRSFSIFFVYLFAFYLILCLLGYYYFRRVNHIDFNSTVFNRLITSLIIFLVVGITLLFVIISYFVLAQTNDKSKKEQQIKVEYVKRLLYDTFKEKNNLSESMIDNSFILQDLSNSLLTDIHIYNPNGELIATSRSMIFINELTSKLMSPKIYFERYESDITQDEHIGNLYYFSSYSRLLNEKGKLLAYISIPGFNSYNELQAEIFNFLAIMISVYLILIFCSFFVSFLLAKRIGKPIKSIEEKLKNIRIGKKNEKIEYKCSDMDEIGQLIDQYNILVDELAYSTELLTKTERELAWKQMARQIAHEIKNPLTPMKLTVQQLQRMKKNGSDKFDAYFEKTADVLIEEIENLSRIASEFSDFAKLPDNNPLQLELIGRLLSAVELFKNNYNHVKIEFHTSIDVAYVWIDAVHLTQIFNNLLKNAIQAIPQEREGKIVIRVTADDSRVYISISDNGSGMSQEVRSKLFLPNFTTKSSGMGLGLAIVKNMIDLSNGEISFTTIENEGTTFYLSFPIVKNLN